MGCYRYSMGDIKIGCSIANGGIKRMVAVDRTKLAELFANKDIEVKHNGEDGLGYVIFTKDALDTIFDTTEANKIAYKVEIKKNTLSIQSTMNEDQSWQNQITPLQIAGADADVHAAVQSMCDNDMAYFVEDRNNLVTFLGFYAPVVMESGTYNSGTTVTDNNGYELTLTERSAECLFEGRYTSGANDLNVASAEQYLAFWNA